MIKLGKQEIPNVINELTIEQFEKVSEFTNNQELDAFEKWVSVFTYLGANEDEVNEMDFSEFKDKVKEFNTVTYKASTKKKRTIEIEGFKYVSYDKKFKLSVRDIKHIEKIIKKDPTRYVSKMLAVIFKREDLNIQEHYSDAHIKHIEKIIKKDPTRYVSKMLAVIFKREDLDTVEHYSDAHIKHKSNLFKSLNAEIALPFMAYVADKLKDTAKQLTNEVAAVVESNNG